MRILAFLLFLWLPFSAVAQTADSDRGYLQGLLEDALSGQGRSVRIEGFAGALSSRATIDKITIADADGIWLTLSDVAMIWSRSALLSGAVEIDEISVDILSLPRLPLSQSDPVVVEASGGFTLPELPVSVSLAKLKVNRADLGAPLFGEAASVSLAGSAELAAGAGKADIKVTRLDVDGALTFAAEFKDASRNLTLALDLSEPAGGIAANLLQLPGAPSLELAISGEGPLDDFAANLRLATDAQERLAGSVTLIGTDADGTAFDMNIGGDIAPILAPKYRDFLGRDIVLRARGTRQATGALTLDALALRSAALALDGSAALATDGWPVLLELNGAITPQTNGRVILPLPGPTLSLSDATLQVSFDAAAGEAWVFATQVTDLHRDDDRVGQLALSGNGVIDRAGQSVSGALKFDASGVAPAEAALARAIGSQISGAVNLAWQNSNAVTLRDISLQGADYGLTGAVDIAAHATDLDVIISPEVRLRAQDLTRFGPLSGLSLEGAAELEIAGQVAPVSGLFALTFKGVTGDIVTGIAQLDPLLAGKGLLNASVTRDQAGLRVEPMAFQTDLARIGTIADIKTGASNVKADLDITQLASVLPGLRGAAKVALTAVQNDLTWQVAVDGHLPGGTWLDFDGQVIGDGREALAATGELTAAADSLSAYSQLAVLPLSGAATLTAAGSTDILARTFDVSAGGETRSLNLGIPGISPLIGGTIRYDASAARDATGMIRISKFALRGREVKADVTGQISASQSALEYAVSLANLGVLVSEIPGAASLTGTARQKSGPWFISAAGKGPGGILLNTDGRVSADGKLFDLGLQGRAPLALANRQLSGQSLSGQVTFDLFVNGPPALSSVSGVLRTDGARLSMPGQNIVLSPVNGAVTLAGATANVELNAKLQSGGRLEISGPIALTAPFDASLQARLREAVLRENDLFEASLGGLLNVRGPLTGGARIGGDIDVQSVELRIPNISASYASLEGLKHENLPADVRQTLEFANLLGASQPGGAGPVFPIGLTIRAPSRVFVRGRGLDAELGGILALNGTTANVVPQGQFDLIRGRLDLLGRRLTLTEGSLQLRGSFDPVINFAATTVVDDVSISLRIEGEASSPELTVTSVPELPQEEALSYFLFGRDPENISALQAVQLAAAIRTLSGRGGLGLTGQLRENLGVDDLDISTDSDGNAQASVGKYISEKAYTNVTVNSEGNSQIQLNFDVTPNVTIRGRVTSKGETGIGIFLERNY